jgi:MauM/NapG family ferredoxin protein
MRIVSARRLSQGFFLLLFLWLAVVSTFGDAYTQTSGWPINLFLELDPLIGIATALSTHTVYKGLLWGVLSLAVTLLLGRVFCGWFCPFGTLQQIVGWISRRARKTRDKLAVNRFHRFQGFKYLVLISFLGAAVVGSPGVLQIGLLDPIALLTRSTDLIVAPLISLATGEIFASPRFTSGGWLIGGIFIGLLLASVWIPRFFCRFLCPTGALLGLLSRFAIFRFVRVDASCTDCKRCERDCEGACEPSGALRSAECVVCTNCLESCRDESIDYTSADAPSGVAPAADISRRGFVASLGSGVALFPMLRLDGRTGKDRDPHLVRPPGALDEEAFLSRCIKCGRCMRACPTNVIQPAGGQHGLEALWTPTMNMRIGTSACQLNCIACGQVCPTGAIRPLNYDEKIGRGDFADDGPVRMGLAFVDRNRCLPFAFDRPCIVCQEVCPVSPKAITLRQVTAESSGVQLQQPHVDPEACNGCGICQHECPVSGRPAIRVTAENESRGDGGMFLKLP